MFKKKTELFYSTAYSGEKMGWERIPTFLLHKAYTKTHI